FEHSEALDLSGLFCNLLRALREAGLEALHGHPPALELELRRLECGSALGEVAAFGLEQSGDEGKLLRTGGELGGARFVQARALCELIAELRHLGRERGSALVLACEHGVQRRRFLHGRNERVAALVRERRLFAELLFERRGRGCALLEQ